MRTQALLCFKTHTLLQSIQVLNMLKTIQGWSFFFKTQLFAWIIESLAPTFKSLFEHSRFPWTLNSLLKFYILNLKFKFWFELHTWLTRLHLPEVIHVHCKPSQHALMVYTAWCVLMGTNELLNMDVQLE